MGRNYKKGIDYFSHDVTMRESIEVKLLIAKFGLIGYAFYNLLLEDIYRNGYYIEITEDYKLLFGDAYHLDVSEIEDIINFMTAKNLFNKKLYESYSILTSRRIQENYLTVTTRRKGSESGFIEKKYKIKDVDRNGINVDRNGINVDRNRKNVCSGTQSKVKESKVKKSKVKESKVKESKVISENVNIDFDNDVKNVLLKWNMFAIKHQLPKCIVITPEKKQQLSERFAEEHFNIDKILEAAEQSEFLLGKKSDFKLTLQWIISTQNNYIKILEGNYNEKSKKNVPNRKYGTKAIANGKTIGEYKTGQTGSDDESSRIVKL